MPGVAAVSTGISRGCAGLTNNAGIVDDGADCHARCGVAAFGDFHHATDAIVARVGDEDIAFTVDGHSLRSVEQSAGGRSIITAVAVAAGFAASGDSGEVSGGIYFTNRIVSGICDVDVAGAIGGQSGGRPKRGGSGLRFNFVECDVASACKKGYGTRALGPYKDILRDWRSDINVSCRIFYDCDRARQIHAAWTGTDRTSTGNCIDFILAKGRRGG